MTDPYKFNIPNRSIYILKLIKILDYKINGLWTKYDDYLLINGIFIYGFGNWTAIINDKKLWKYPCIHNHIAFLFSKLCDKYAITNDKNPMLIHMYFIIYF